MYTKKNRIFLFTYELTLNLNQKETIQLSFFDECYNLQMEYKWKHLILLDFCF